MPKLDFVLPKTQPPRKKVKKLLNVLRVAYLFANVMRKVVLSPRNRILETPVVIVF